MNATDETQATSKPAAMKLQVHTISKGGSRAIQQSRQRDPFQEYYTDANRIIRPRFDPFALASLTELSDILGRAIEVMANNIDGFGWELVPAEWVDDEQVKSPAALAEKSLLTRLFNYPNDEAQSLVGLRHCTRKDRESIGCGYWEVLRNGKGEIAELHLLPAITMRLVKRDDRPTEYEEFIRDDSGNYDLVPRRRRFGYYAQISQAGQQPVFFKEFGDPRTIDYQTGRETNDDNVAATEVLAFPIYSSYDSYGLPRWLGAMMDMLGSRKAGYVNYLFFDNKMIPPLVIMVSGGSLTPESITRLNEVINKEIRGVDNFHNALILDAVPANVSEIPGEKISPVKIDVKPLTEFIQNDALFRDYRADVKKTVRSQFGLPGLFTGDNDDYTRATAAESTRVAEEQVFEPDRRSFDYVINRTIFAAFQIRYWSFHSLGAKTSNDTEIVQALSGVADALPVGVIQEAVADMRNVPAGEIAPELYTTTLAEFRNQFQPQFPLLNGNGTDASQRPAQAEDIVKSLIALRQRLTKKLNENGFVTE